MTMLMTEIRRDTPMLIAKCDELTTLAEDAVAVLGYERLLQTLDQPTETPLRDALARLEIQTLNHADVVAYMREQMCERALTALADWTKADPDPLRSWSSFNAPAWIPTEIEKYKEPIPEFVINKAVQIKRELPDVKIFIRHLSENPDPFLEVHYGDVSEWDDKTGERYFIEVWDEPKFEGRLR